MALAMPSSSTMQVVPVYTCTIYHISDFLAGPQSMPELT